MFFSWPGPIDKGDGWEWLFICMPSVAEQNGRVKDFKFSGFRQKAKAFKKKKKKKNYFSFFVDH